MVNNPLVNKLLIISLCLIQLVAINCAAINMDAGSDSSLDFTQLKRSGFLPMRGRKWLEDNSQANQLNLINTRLHLLRAFLDQLVDSNSIDDPSSASGFYAAHSPLPMDNSGHNKKHAESLSSASSSSSPDQLTYPYGYPGWFSQFLSNSIGNSPKRAGFLPMRGRKSDVSNAVEPLDRNPSDLTQWLVRDEQDKRAGFMPMRGKKQIQEESAKRAFHALRGK